MSSHPDRIARILRRSRRTVSDAARAARSRRLPGATNVGGLPPFESLESRQLMSAYGGTPWAIPGVVQAENFDTGGEGVAYHDTSAQNEGGAYRNEGPDLVDAVNDDGTYALGWTKRGEWLKYSVDVASSGSYTLGARVSSVVNSSQLRVEVDGTNVTGTLSVPNTQSFDTWSTVNKAGVNLAAGSHTLRVYVLRPGFRLNYLSFAPEATAPTAPAAPTGLAASPASSSQIDLSWVDNSSNETGFKVERSTDGVNFAQIASVGAGVTSYAAIGLGASTPYAFRVRATNAVGDSAFSNTASATTAAVPGPTPALVSEDFSAGAGGFGVVDGPWSASGGTFAVTADNNAATTHLNSRAVHSASVAGDFTLDVDARALSASAPWANFAVVFGYQDPQNYYFFSSNQNNDEETSGIFKVVNGTSTELADAPSTIAPGVGYHVKVVRSGTQVLAYRDGALVASATDGTFTTGRVGLGTRQFKATFDNVVVTGQAAPAPVAPAAPSSLTATASSPSQVNLAWSDNSGNEDGFKVERSTDGVTFTQVGTVGANVRSYAATGLAASTAYSFRVRAYNAGGNSAYSNAATATTQGVPTGTVPKPDATNTGYTGTLTTYNGQYFARAGEVIENKLITGGVVIPAGADNVTIRNCRITGGQYGIQSFDDARNLLVQDTEIDGSAYPGAIGSKGIAGANFTVLRCHIHHAGSDGVQTFGSNITVRQCYIHDCGYGGYNAADPTSSDHTDGIQVFGGSHILIEYNTVITRHGGTRDDGVSTGYPLQSQVNPYGTANAAVVIQSDSDTGGAIDDFQVSNNWLDGGIFTLRLEEKDGNEMTNGRVFGNRFGRDYYFGPAYVLGTPSYTASDNLFDATGTPVSGL